MQISREKLAYALRKTYLFRGLNEDQIQFLSENCQPLYFDSGKMVYLEKSPAIKIYLPYQGRVEILKEKENKLRKINAAYPGIVFGEDALDHHPIRRSGARAVEDSIFLAIDGDIVQKIAAREPKLAKLISRFLNSYRLVLSRRFSRGEDEAVLFASQSFPVRVIGRIVLGVVAATGAGALALQVMKSIGTTTAVGLWFWLILFLSLAGWLFWQYLNWDNDAFYITDKRVINFQHKMLSSEITQEIHFTSIESIQEKRPFLGRIMNYGDLIISTFTGSMAVPQVYDTPLVKDFLDFSVDFSSSSEDRVDRKKFEQDIRRRITYKQKGQKYTPESENQDLSDDNIRGDDSDGENISEEILIRTHWTVLFSKIFIPMFLFISHFLIFFFIHLNEIILENRPLFNSIFLLNITLLSIWVLFRAVDWRNDHYIITEQLLVDVNKRPFGVEDRRTASIQNIQSIRYKRNGIFGLLLNFGTVFIRIGDDEFTFDNVFRPARVQEKIFEVKERARLKEEAEQQSGIRNSALDWIEAYHNLANREDDKPRPAEGEEK